MAGPSRKSLGAVRFSVAEGSPSTTLSPSRRRRSLGVQKVVDTFEENDDEAELQARRVQTETGSPASTSMTGNDRRQSTMGMASIASLSSTEISNQIAQCIKLSAENKINDKNAFQLKMIDFLVYTLKKQDPNMTNLQMASVSLDASAKIYGFRVDKVHSDLLKIIGMAKQAGRDHPDENGDNPDADQPDGDKNDGQQKKKKKKKRQHIITTAEALKGTVETYDPLSLIRCNRDTQTSDMLFQAGLPQHANQGVALNLYNDVVLDKIPASDNAEPVAKMSSHLVDDFTNHKVCPSYAAFKFLDWSPDDEPEEPTSQPEDNNGEYHFDLDAAVPDDDALDNDIMMDCDDAYEQRCDRLAQNQNVENIVDFQDIIANNPNPNATYEYSYLQKSYRIHWAGPSHWKITLNRNLGGSRIVETCKQHQVRKKKDIEMKYEADTKEECKLKFTHVNRQTKLLTRTTKLVWAEEKVTFPRDVHYDLKRYYGFFNKPTEFLRLPDDNQTEMQANDNDDGGDNVGFGVDDHDISGFEAPVDIPENFGGDNNDEFLTQLTQDTAVTQSQGAFVGDNLVSAPKGVDKIFIPYSQRAKKIDMRQLKRAMWKNLRKNNKETERENFDITNAVENENNSKDIEPKPFSNVYLEVPRLLSKLNAESLSPAIAFVSLLHLANEKNLKIDRNPDMSDLIVKSVQKDTASIF